MAFRFETLNVWREARSFTAIVYKVAEQFPRHEAFGLTSQPHRAANAVPLLIAEGSALPSERLFHHRLGLAPGELAEAVCATHLALDRGYLKEIEQTQLYDRAQSLARQIQGLKNTLA
jgi:four helix bundle protein